MLSPIQTYNALYFRLDAAINGRLESAMQTFVHFMPTMGATRYDYAGYKYTITGRTIEDAKELAERLGDFCNRLGLQYKLITSAMIAAATRKDSLQRFKAMTIYIRKDLDTELFEDDLRHFLKGYTGGEGVVLPSGKGEYDAKHLFGSVWMRRDEDENGKYIPA